MEEQSDEAISIHNVQQASRLSLLNKKWIINVGVQFIEPAIK